MSGTVKYIIVPAFGYLEFDTMSGTVEYIIVPAFGDLEFDTLETGIEEGWTQHFTSSTTTISPEINLLHLFFYKWECSHEKGTLAILIFGRHAMFGP
jgi:hypothetical protein